MTALVNDLRHAVRLLAHSPGLAAAAIVSMALGIGANTALFSVTSALLLRPLPYADPDRLVILWNRSPGLNITEDWFSTAQYFDIRNGYDGFDALAIAIGANMNLSDPASGEPERVGVIRVSSNLLPMLGARPVAGRLFEAREDAPGQPRAAVLSHGTWTRRYGADTMAEIEWTAWNDQVVPELDRMRGEFLPPGTTYDDPNQAVPEADRATTRVVYTGLFTAGPETAELAKPQLVTWLLGSHEYLLQCIEAWATQITVRYGLDVMFDIQYTLWGDTVLPGAKRLKERYFGITGNTVEDWMKDLQIDATALPGKAFDLSFEMPAPDVGIMTFNRCAAPTMFEALGRVDILEQNCHAVCPASIEETAKLYNPNMKMEILAIPPRVSDKHVCCVWKLSMRDENDPDYIPVTQLS